MVHPADGYEGVQGGGYPPPTGARDEYNYDISGNARANYLVPEDTSTSGQRVENGPSIFLTRTSSTTASSGASTGNSGTGNTGRSSDESKRLLENGNVVLREGPEVASNDTYFLSGNVGTFYYQPQTDVNSLSYAGSTSQASQSTLVNFNTDDAGPKNSIPAKEIIHMFPNNGDSYTYRFIDSYLTGG